MYGNSVFFNILAMGDKSNIDWLFVPMFFCFFSLKNGNDCGLFSKMWHCASVESSFVHACEVSDGKWPKVFRVSDVYAIRFSKIVVHAV